MIVSTLTLKQEVEEACKSHDIFSVLNMSSNKRTIVCPLPSHQHVNFTPSFSIFWRDGRQRWICFGSCGLEGDVVDLVGNMNVHNYKKHDPESVRKALALLDMKYEFKMPVKPKKTLLTGDKWKLYTPFGEDVKEYAERRGLTEATLTKFKIGQDRNYMTIPAFEDQMLKGIKKRRLTAGNPRFIQEKGSVSALFNHDAVKHTKQAVLFVKGEIPVMLLDQHGILACSPTTGEAMREEYWKPLLAFSKRIVVVGDNDDVGREKAKLTSDFFNTELKFPPGRFKDIDEWILADSQAINKIKSWLK